MKLGTHLLFAYVGRMVAGAKKVFTGATATVAGSSGAVPPPGIGDDLKFLAGSAGWKYESFRGAYSTAKAYLAGNFCVNNGVMVYCNADIPAGTAFAWGGNGATWQPQLDSSVTFQGLYGAATVYGAGSVVALANNRSLLYKSLVANNVGKALTDLSSWIPYSQSLDVGGISSVALTASNSISSSPSTILSKMLLETVQISAAAIAAAPTLTFELSNGLVILYTVAPTSNWSINCVGVAATTLNATMAIGQCVTFTQLIQMGATAYMPTAVSVDGQLKTEMWSLGVKPTAGIANALNIYSYTIIKTADQSFLVLADQSSFK